MIDGAINNVFSILRENQEIYKFTQIYGLDGFLLFDPDDLSSTWLNPRLRSVLGYELDSFEKRENISKFIEEEEIIFFIKSGKEKAALSLRHLQGSKIQFTARILKIEDPDSSYFLLGLTQNDLSLKSKDHLLKKINRYEKIIEGTELGNWQWNIQTGETIFSNNWAEILGYSLKELQPTSVKTWEIFAHPLDMERCNKELQEHFEGKTEHYITDARMKHKSGQWIWVRDKGKVVTWTANGEPEWMTGFHRDITEEKSQLEVKKFFIDQAPSAIAMFDTDMRYIAASNKWLSDYNIKKTIITGEYHYEMFPDISKEWKEIHAKCLQGETHSRDEDCIIWPSGREQWISWEVKPWFTNENKIGGLLIHTADITPLKQTEKEMFSKQHLMEKVLSSIDVGIVACDKHGKLSLFNSATRDWHGLPAEDIPQQSLSNYYGLYSIDGNKELSSEEIPLLKTLQHGSLENQEIMIKPKTGKHRKVSVNGSQLFDENGNIAGAVVAMHDITKRVEAEKKHRISERTFRGSFEHAAIGMAVVYPGGKWAQVNNRVCEIVGYTQQELMELTFQDITHPEDLNLDLDLLNELKEGKRDYYHMDKRYFHKDGHIVYIHLAVSLVRNEENKPLFFVSQITDISKEKIAEKKLKKTLAELENLLEASTQVSIISINTNGIITEFNKGAENLLGYQKDEIIGEKSLDFIHSKTELKSRSKEFRKHYKEKVEGVALLMALANKKGHDTQEWLYKPKKGALFPVQLTLTAIKDNKETIGYLGVATNISKLKNAENELSNILELTKDQNDRLKNFAHIVSHNLRSHSGNLGMLLDLYIEDYPQQKDNQIIEMLYKSSGNLKETIEHLNEVTVINTTVGESLVEINLHEEIEKAYNSIGALMNNAQLELINNVPEDCKIFGTRAYIESILLNFTTNAIKYRSTERDSFVRFEVRETKKHIQLSIEDNGLGIDLKRHRQKLFGMYKTFHNHKDSRGIGLFITKNQIEAMGGRIDVESEINKGTKFTISLRKDEKS